MPVLLRCLLVLSLALGAAQAAAPLPEDPALDRPVTATAIGYMPVVLPALAKASGLKLSADAHVSGLAAALYVRDVPLRHVLAAILGDSGLEWKREGAGAYRLTGPSVMAPAMDNRKLLRALLMACPSQVRPPAIGQAPRTMEMPIPMDRIYALLPRPQVDAIEDGEAIPFAQLPPTVRRTLRERDAEMARRQLCLTLSPRWMVPVERLALRVNAHGQGTYWHLYIRKAPAANPPAPPASGKSPRRPPEEFEAQPVPIPYQPPGKLVSSNPDESSVGADAFALARETGANVILDSSGFWTSSGEAEGDTFEAKLLSLVPEGVRERYVCRLRDGIYRLDPARAPASHPETAALARFRPTSTRSCRKATARSWRWMTA